MTTTRIYKATCPFCGLISETPFRSAARDGLACGTGPCLDAYNAQVEAAKLAQKRRQAERRAERRSNPLQAVQVGDAAGWANAARLSR